MPKPDRRYDIVAGIFCIGVLILALVIGSLREVGNFGVETDFYGAYAPQAQNIMAGRSYTYRHNPPGYALLLGAVSFLTGDLFAAGKMISAFATALLGWISYLLLKALFDSRIALASTILLLVAMVPYSFLAATDIIGATAIVLPLWILLRRPVLSFSACFLAGVFGGVAYLVRTPAIFVIAGIGFSLLFINLNKETVRACFVRTGVFVCGVLLVTSPWLIINWEKNGSPFASTAYAQIAAHFFHPLGDAFGTSVQRKATQFRSLWDVVLHNPLVVLRTYIKDVLYRNPIKLASQGLQFPSYLFAGGGLVLLLRDLSRRRLTFLGVCLLGYLLLGLVGFYLRYYFFLFPFLFLLVTYFLFEEHIATTLGQIAFLRIPLSWLILIILTACLGYDGYQATKRTIKSEPRYLIEIADFLRSRSSPNDMIVVRKPHLAYLAGLKGAFPLVETKDEFLWKSREIGARYVAYSDYEASLWPGLRSLRDPETVPWGLRLIYEHKPTHTLIYEVVGLAGGAIKDGIGPGVVQELTHIAESSRRSQTGSKWNP